MQKENRVSLLVSNILVYGFNQVVVMLIPMIMLPIYSRLLPDISVFGASSLTTTICTLASAIAGFGMFDAAVRFAFDSDEEKYKKSVCTSAFVFMLITSSICVIIIIIFNKLISRAFYGAGCYSGLVIIAGVMAFFSVMNSAALIPVRINNDKKITIINSLIKAIVSVIITIILLLNGINLYAIPIGTLVGLGVSWFFLFYKVQKKYIVFSTLNIKLIKNMFVYAAPLMFTFVSYWIYQSADKIMLSNISNLTETGIYAIGAKVGSISGVLQNAFASGWAYFAFSTMNDADQKGLIAKIFRLFTIICVVITFGVMAFIAPAFKLVFAKGDYLLGAPICAALFFSPLQLTLMQIIGSQLLISKNTRIYSVVQLFGAISNVFLNFVLINRFGARGAAASTLIGYTIPLLFLYFYLTNKKELKFDSKIIGILVFSIIILVVNTLFVESDYYSLVVGCLCIFIMFILNLSDIKQLFLYLNKMRRKK